MHHHHRGTRLRLVGMYVTTAFGSLGHRCPQRLWWWFTLGIYLRLGWPRGWLREAQVGDERLRSEPKSQRLREHRTEPLGAKRSLRSAIVRPGAVPLTSNTVDFGSVCKVALHKCYA